FSSYKYAFCTVFSPDGSEYFFTTDIDNNDTADIACMKRINNQWTKPEEALFNSKYNDNDICISPDGSKVFFRSWRPLPGRSNSEERSYLWFSDKTESGWSKALPLKCETGYIKTGYPAIAKSGTLYLPCRFTGKPGESDILDIYRLDLNKGSYGTLVNLGNTVNTEYAEGDMCIASDESFLIVSCWYRPDNNGEADLYVSFRNRSGEWSSLIGMGDLINNESNENCPMLSPDGKYLFFHRYYPDTERSEDIWVDAKIIDRFRPDDMK
ncbi:hypothetical protein ACFL6G_07330, partial [candidate division KSB1 bacterium]